MDENRLDSKGLEFVSKQFQVLRVKVDWLKKFNGTESTRRVSPRGVSGSPLETCQKFLLQFNASTFECKLAAIPWNTCLDLETVLLAFGFLIAGALIGRFQHSNGARSVTSPCLKECFV